MGKVLCLSEVSGPLSLNGCVGDAMGPPTQTSCPKDPGQGGGIASPEKPQPTGQAAFTSPLSAPPGALFQPFKHKGEDRPGQAMAASRLW